MAQNLLNINEINKIGMQIKQPDLKAISRIKVGKDVIRETAEQFEAFFLRTVLDDLGKGIGSDFLGGGGHAEEIWRSMLNEEFAKAITSSGGVGIADSVYNETTSTSGGKVNNGQQHSKLPLSRDKES